MSLNPFQTYSDLMVKDVRGKTTFVSIVTVKQVSHPQTQPQPRYSKNTRQICLKMYAFWYGLSGNRHLQNKK